jgi:hypothetical protein
MTTISAKADVITLINVFAVEPGPSELREAKFDRPGSSDERDFSARLHGVAAGLERSSQAPSPMLSRLPFVKSAACVRLI